MHSSEFNLDVTDVESQHGSENEKKDNGKMSSPETNSNNSSRRASVCGTTTASEVSPHD